MLGLYPVYEVQITELHPRRQTSGIVSTVMHETGGFVFSALRSQTRNARNEYNDRVARAAPLHMMNQLLACIAIASLSIDHIGLQTYALT